MAASLIGREWPNTISQKRGWRQNPFLIKRNSLRNIFLENFLRKFLSTCYRIAPVAGHRFEIKKKRICPNTQDSPSPNKTLRSNTILLFIIFSRKKLEKNKSDLRLKNTFQKNIQQIFFSATRNHTFLDNKNNFWELYKWFMLGRTW